MKSPGQIVFSPSHPRLLWLAAVILPLAFLAVRADEGAARNPFFAYNFGRLTESSPAAQVGLLQRLGYDGISLGCESDADLKGLDEYFAAVDRAPRTFRIFAVYVFYNFKAPPAERDRWKTLLERIAGRGISLWLIVGPPAENTTPADVTAIIGTIADAARLQQTEVVLYPHSKCSIASAEAALPFLTQLHRPNLGLAVHLCHELRAGNVDRLDAVVRNVAPFIRFATLAGTNATVDRTSSRTMENSTIKPLDEGDYDLRKFLRALRAVDYRGPIGFINFMIEQEPADYLARSISKWRTLNVEAAAPHRE